MSNKFKNGLAKHESGTYHYCFRIKGRQYKGSTRATDFATAKKFLEEKRKEAILGKSCLPKQVPSTSKLVEEWLANHEATASPSHLRSVREVAKNWILPTLGRLRIDQVTACHILEIRTSILSKRLKVATANHVSRVVSLLWNYAVLVGHIEAVPFHVKPLKHQKTPRPTLSAFKVTEFLSAVDRRTRNPQIRVLIRAMIGLGLRESEALGMRWEWMDPDRRIYTVGKAKGKEARVLPVPAWVWNAIQAMPKNLSPWVFPNKVGGVHRPQYCKPTLKRVCEELKLGNITQHRLRATFATLHAEAGTPITDIQNMLGHKDIATTMIYVEQSMESKRRAQDALSLKLGLA